MKKRERAITVELGPSIKKRRQEAGLTQTELGEMLGYKKATISSWELGRTEPNMGALEEMSKIFHCKKEDLIEYTSIDYMAYVNAKVTPEEYVLIESIRKMGMQNDIQRILKYIEALEQLTHKED